MQVSRLDHLVLTVKNIDRSISFYVKVLGMREESFKPADGTIRTALKFGDQKINLHLAGAEFEPKSENPTPGSADLCFLTDETLENWQDHLTRYQVPIEEGPIARTGATAPITSIYVRDPDRNLIEISVLSD